MVELEDKTPGAAPKILSNGAHPLVLQQKSAVFCQNVKKSYDGKRILQDIDLALAPGSFNSFVGPSGSGKSTMLRLILGQEFPDSGILEINQQPVSFPDASRGVVFQKYSLYPHRTVLGNITLGIELGMWLWQRIGKHAEIKERAYHFLEMVSLADHADLYPHQLSGGQCQRVAIAQALIMEPKIILMDEPFGALDPGTRESMQVCILKLWERLNKERIMTIVFVTHDLEEALYLGTRILVLSQYYEDSLPGPRGSRIVYDRALPSQALSTKVKETAEFGKLLQEVRYSGFDPNNHQTVEHFNLSHPDSFTTFGY